ncbi:metalloregulator ArsR/SmtB family transcription factor [Rheinheimera baltica]|jgi:ArsR family transcriptional regulator, arsenate/arsenite/antimonite-responsive transcriptional repressor|uniref:Metalloregulator ArsR/SmtB family transcription factor n=1 Tax=Rheinheimera baltica TaxID=67576 RepID=A0ABT9HVE0_9GAMM|nr:metalloregulator ArsR/SmtB family transcription factor [Rheinheimera baltica]MDP5135094.1 metalloregulator ArsR/SmtB family transcription factor [Rheinheimera baltica]MDP5188584.1 metalloregulator ArsR/SmtB family transcription factor [Rheinheimera baltica]
MEIDYVFEALASTPRRKILAYLSEATLTAGEIAARFDMSKPALSKHLKILEQAKLISSERKGQFIEYRLADKNMMVSLTNMLATFCPVGSGLKKESTAIARSKDKTTKQE